MKTITISKELENKVTHWKVFTEDKSIVQIFSKFLGTKTAQSALNEMLKQYDKDKLTFYVSGLTMHAETKPVLKS